MTDTSYFDISEKVAILIKQSFGFPTTSENKQWYEETAVKYNNYLIGEDILLDIIPNIPDFDVSGIVQTANNLGLNNSDFVNYSDTSSNKSICNIVDDSTGTVRRYKNIILEECPQLGSDAGASWYKLDISDNNILTDAFQFNFKQYNDINGITHQPYLYRLYSQESISTASPNLPFGQNGGNWFFDLKSGILFFSDFNNFSNGIQTTAKFQINITNNKPVLSFYKYIGRKGITRFIPTTTTYNILQIASTDILTGLSDEIINGLSYETINDISLGLIAIKNNSKYKILLNFNYLSSNYYDTLLKIAVCYNINNGSENIIGEYLLGNENTNFHYDFFSNNFYQDITSNIGDNIHFYIKAKISSNYNTNVVYSTLDDIYKPKILLSSIGNILNIEEVNI